MERLEFYERLGVARGQPLTRLETKLLDIACNDDAFLPRPTEFVPLETVEQRLAEGGIGYWLYDRRSRTWLLNLPTGTHTVLAGTLHNIYANEAGDHDGAAERYIEGHYGFYISGAMRLYIPIKASSYELSAEEQVFDRAKGRLPWRGID